MTNCNCRTKLDCTLLSIAASVLVGITVAILSFTAIITVAPAFFWVALGVAGVFLATLLLTSVGIGHLRNYCACNIISIILIGIVLTILAGLILLAVTLAATSVLRAILIGVLTGGLTLIITSVFCLIKCLANCNYDED